MKAIKKIIITFFIIITTTTSLSAQSNETIFWTVGKSWSNGFSALPDVCTNLNEFKTQYNKNKSQWDAMFKWLASNDLKSISAGKHSIEGTSIVVSVEDSKNEPLNKRQSESHYKHIDFQYVVKGTERFGLIDHDSSKPNCEYKPDVIHYDYDKAKTVFIDSTPERFFLFFPDDWHIAKISTDNQSQDIRVIVVKLDYVE